MDRPLLAWALVFVGALGLASLLAPFVYQALGGVEAAAQWPYSRVFNRTAMAIAGLLLWRFRRELGGRRLAPLFAFPSAATGSVAALAQIGAGFAAGLLGTGAAVAAALALGRLGPATGPFELFDGRSATALAGAFVVALVEESFFRGMMLGSLAPRFGRRAAVFLSSGLFALAHLMVSDPALRRERFSLPAGFSYLAEALGRQLEPAALGPLFGTFLCGVLLSILVLRCRSLYPAIGLHASWAFAFQTLRHATRPLVPIPGSGYFAKHSYLFGTPWAWGGATLGLGLAVLWCVRRGNRASRDLPGEPLRSRF